MKKNKQQKKQIVASKSLKLHFFERKHENILWN
jgi:hypothetical protein